MEWRKLTFLGLLLSGAAGSVWSEEPVTVATWNVGFIDRGPLDLKLQDFAREVDADVLLLNEVKTEADVEAIRDGLGRGQDAVAISNFETGDHDLEVGIISRYPIASLVEFDRSPEKGQTRPKQVRLERVRLPGIADVGVARGFLEAEIPALKLYVISTHLKSSLGRTGAQDRENAQKRELVAAAIATEVNHLLADRPDWTVIVAGDMNVGVSDGAKNGTSLTEDADSGPGDRYDETHALLTGGLVGGLRMRHLAEGLPGTYVGEDNIPDYPGAGAIDAIYVAGADAARFSREQRVSDRFGSDHLAVYTTTGTVAAPPAPAPGSAANSGIQIVALLPNPDGPDAGNETITLENSGNPVTLAGWKFVDAAGNTYGIPPGTIVPHGRLVIHLERNTMPLNNNGDTIRLLDEQGKEIGPAFTYSESAVRPGVEISR